MQYRVVAAFVLTLATGGAARAAAGSAIPTRDFARYPAFNSMRLSPGGQYLAVTARVGNESSLAIIKLPEKKLLSGLRFKGESAVYDVIWKSDERLLIEMGYQDTPDADPAPSGELYAMNADGSGKQYLYGMQENSWLQRMASKPTEFGVATVEDPLLYDGTRALVRVETNTVARADSYFIKPSFTPVYLLDVLSGRKQLLAKAPMLAPQHYLTDASTRVLLVSGDDGANRLHKTFWRRGDMAWKQLSFDAGLDAIKVSADGRRAFFTRDDGKGGECLLEWEIPATATAPEGVPRQVICRNVAFLGRIYFTAQDRPYAWSTGQDAAQFIDTQAAESTWLASLQAQFPGQVLLPAGRSRNGRTMLYRLHSDRNSGEYYLYDTVTHKAVFLDALQPWLDPERMASVRSLRFKARDGLELSALLTVPPGSEAKKLPLVVLPHGGPIGVVDDWSWQSQPQFLASRGYAVLQVNFRGSGGRGDAFEKLGFGQWGGKMIDDITDGTRWAVSTGVADPARLCIFGGSYGGYAAPMSAVREPDLYRCAIGYAGVYDLNQLVKDSDVTLTAEGRQFWRDSMAATPEVRAALSPLTSIARLKAAVMIVHGEEDTRAPFTQAKALRSALEARHWPYEWLVDREAGHGFFTESSRTELYDRVAAFLDRNIGRPAPPPTP